MATVVVWSHGEYTCLRAIVVHYDSLIGHGSVSCPNLFTRRTASANVKLPTIAPVLIPVHILVPGHFERYTSYDFIAYDN